MKNEHIQIRKCFIDLGNPSYTLIEQFYNLPEQHIRFEERTLFPLLEQTLNESNFRKQEKNCSIFTINPVQTFL